jgi:predicted branched-subunit amino acid permease
MTMTMTTLKCVGRYGVDRASGVGARPRSGAPPSTWRTPFWEGALASLPLWLSVVPVGLAFGLAAHGAGLESSEAIGMSMLVNGAVAQFGAVALLASGADSASIVLATLAINLRYTPCALSLAPFLAASSRVQRAILAFGLNDHSYALSVRRIQAGERGGALFFLGAALSTYIARVLATATGASLEDALPNPAELGLHLVYPLTLGALLMPFLKSRAAWAAALVAAALALGARPLLPGDWEIVVAALVGGLTGAWLEAGQ